MSGRRTALWVVAVLCCLASTAVIVVGTVRVHQLRSTAIRQSRKRKHPGHDSEDNA